MGQIPSGGVPRVPHLYPAASGDLHCCCRYHVVPFLLLSSFKRRRLLSVLFRLHLWIVSPAASTVPCCACICDWHSFDVLCAACIGIGVQPLAVGFAISLLLGYAAAVPSLSACIRCTDSRSVVAKDAGLIHSYGVCYLALQRGGVASSCVVAKDAGFPLATLCTSVLSVCVLLSTAGLYGALLHCFPPYLQWIIPLQL